jgi:hypothetical protein
VSSMRTAELGYFLARPVGARLAAGWLWVALFSFRLFLSILAPSLSFQENRRTYILCARHNLFDRSLSLSRGTTERNAETGGPRSKPAFGLSPNRGVRFFGLRDTVQRVSHGSAMTKSVSHITRRKTHGQCANFISKVPAIWGSHALTSSAPRTDQRCDSCFSLVDPIQ